MSERALVARIDNLERQLRGRHVVDPKSVETRLRALEARRLVSTTSSAGGGSGGGGGGSSGVLYFDGGGPADNPAAIILDAGGP